MTKIVDGLHERIPEPIYRNSDEWSDRISPSVLEWKKVSAAHCKASFDGELKPQTKALAFGTACHCALLEPQRFADQYAIRGQCEAITGRKTRCECTGKERIDGKWYCGTKGHMPDGAYDEIEKVSEADSAIIPKLTASVFGHAAVTLFRQNEGQMVECCLAWTDPRTGVKCKGRLDKLILKCALWEGGKRITAPAVLDLKTVDSCDYDRLQWKIADYGWHRRAAMYCDGLEALGLVESAAHVRYFLVCIEKQSPFITVVKMIDDEAMQVGRTEYRGHLRAWAHCVKTGTYPAYPNADDVEPIGLPAKYDTSGILSEESE